MKRKQERKEDRLNKVIAKAKEAQRRVDFYEGKAAPGNKREERYLRSPYNNPDNRATNALHYTVKANRLNKKANRLSYGGMCK